MFSFIYCIIVIKDIKPDVVEKYHDSNIATGHCNKSGLLAITDFFDLKHVKEALQVTFKRGNDDKRRTDIFMLFVIMVIILGPLSGLYIKLLFYEYTICILFKIYKLNKIW